MIYATVVLCYTASLLMILHTPFFTEFQLDFINVAQTFRIHDICACHIFRRQVSRSAFPQLNSLSRLPPSSFIFDMVNYIMDISMFLLLQSFSINAIFSNSCFRKFTNRPLNGYHCNTEYYANTTSIPRHRCTNLCTQDPQCRVLSYNPVTQRCLMGAEPCKAAEASAHSSLMVFREMEDVIDSAAPSLLTSISVSSWPGPPLNFGLPCIHTPLVSVNGGSKGYLDVSL